MDKKPTDAEIVKALECCCEAELKEDCQKLKCPFFDNESYNCMNVDDENAMYRYSLDLINRLQAENKKNENIIRLADKTIETANAEIEELKLKNSNLNSDLSSFKNDLSSAVAENERLKKGWKADILLTQNTKAEAYKECIELVEKE